MVLFLGLQISIPNLELFPDRVPIEDDHTDFAQEERLGLPCWTNGHLCFGGRRIQISGHSDFGILNNDGASSTLT